ncbi:hypothetical protein FOL47_009789 [Perkinsus chesapeaki]|uniref:Tyr recombinase domain-containing protein n=1 Tax=Perkinsus chesapeaki TaxID=330153 RepID=A0A7J6L6C4_PERCH|nr:hypothetical protein FOL47_009789 [Perkinsus chesapeaki]
MASNNQIPSPKRRRGGRRSKMNEILRKAKQALIHARLADLVEVVAFQGILVIRPRLEAGPNITYGYPSARQSVYNIIHAEDRASDVSSPAEHIEWALQQQFIEPPRVELPSMLQATVAVQNELPPEDINWLRANNKLKLHSWLGTTKCGQEIAYKSRFIRPTLSNWKLDRIIELVKVTRFRDEDIVFDLALGFPLTGVIPDGGLFPVSPKPKIARHSPQDLHLTTPALKALHSYLINNFDNPLMNEAIVEDVHNEVSLLRAIGPFSLEDIPAAVNFISPLFAVQQHDKVRLISNYSYRTSGVKLNDTATIYHKVQFPRLLHVAEVSRKLQHRGPQTIFRSDHKSAYRQLPIKCEDAWRACGMFLTATSEPKVVVPLRCPFGAVASVSNYLRLSEMITHFSRSLGWINQLAYMDDFFAVEHTLSGNGAHDFFLFINHLIGAEIKREKDVPPSSSVVLLGLLVDLVEGKVRVALTDDRRKSLRSALTSVLLRESQVDSKLAGKVSFACEALYGRAGRGPARVLIRKALGIEVSDENVRSAVKLLLDIFSSSQTCNDLSARLLNTRSPYICYTDAATSSGKIAVYAPPQLNLPAQFSVVQTSSSGHINVLELIGIGIALETFHTMAANRPLLIFSDSRVAEHALLKGSSTSDALGLAVHSLWLRVASLHQLQFYIAHVSSSANPADAPSRGDYNTPWLRGAVKLPGIVPAWAVDSGLGLQSLFSTLSRLHQMSHRSPPLLVAPLILGIIKNPTKLLDALRLESVFTVRDLWAWAPRGLSRSSEIRWQILTTHPDFKAALLAEDLPFLPFQEHSLLLAHLSPTTWKSYRSALKCFLLWHWSHFPRTTIFPVSSNAIRSFITTKQAHVRYVSVIKKIHEILSLRINFDDPLTNLMVKGALKVLNQRRNPKVFLSFRHLRGIVDIARSNNLILFSALCVLGYSFGLRIPSELLDVSNRDILFSGSSVYLTLHRRKNSSVPSHLHRSCTCSSTGSDLCPVEAARIVVDHQLESISLSTFNRLLKHCSKALPDISGHASSHAFRRGFTTDLVLANVPGSTIDKFGGWKSSTTKLHYLNRCARKCLQSKRH